MVFGKIMSYEVGNHSFSSFVSSLCDSFSRISEDDLDSLYDNDEDDDEKCRKVDIIFNHVVKDTVSTSSSVESSLPSKDFVRAKLSRWNSEEELRANVLVPPMGQGKSKLARWNSAEDLIVRQNKIVDSLLSPKRRELHLRTNSDSSIKMPVRKASPRGGRRDTVATAVNARRNQSPINGSKNATWENVADSDQKVSLAKKKMVFDLLFQTSDKKMVRPERSNSNRKLGNHACVPSSYSPTKPQRQNSCR